MSGRWFPYGKQYLGYAEYRAVRRVLKSPFLTQGPEVERFEEGLKRATGAPYAVAVANGTVALDLAVRAVKILYGLEDGALALTSPNTFVASSNALLYNNLTPLFCDIEIQTGNLDLTELKVLLESHKKSKAVELLLPVHFAGEPVDMAEIWQLAREYAKVSKVPRIPRIPTGTGFFKKWFSKNKALEEGGEVLKKRLPIIEDAAHALGSFYKGGAEVLVGSCAYSDACCFSFHPVKTVTTGEGGAITCKDPHLYQLLLMLRSHGINREEWDYLAENCPDDPEARWYYEMQYLGQNARLSDVHAAIGTVQLRRLQGFAAKRQQIAERYRLAFADLEWLRTPSIGRATCPHLYVVQLDFAHLGLLRSAVMEELRGQGIGTQVHYIPVPMQPYYRHLGYDMSDLKGAEDFYHSALSLPLYSTLRPRQQKHIIRCVRGLSS